MKALWHRLLLFLGIRNDWEWAGPDLGPEVPHPYVQHKTRLCCNYCGGGPKNAIHKPPFDPRRASEVLEDAAKDPERLSLVRFRERIGPSPEGWDSGTMGTYPTHDGHMLEHFPGLCDCLTCWCHKARTEVSLEQSRAAQRDFDVTEFWHKQLREHIAKSPQKYVEREH